MKFVDTHSHIYGEEYDEDREAVVERAIAAGALKILLPNIDANSIGPMLALCDAYPEVCHPMMGLHPEELPEDPSFLLGQMKRMLDAQAVKTADGRISNRTYVAIGEVGIDLYWDASRKAEQIEVFRQQVEWSIAYQLPLVIHTRSAHRELVDTLAPYRDQLFGGIFHCFGGTADEARELLTFPGFSLGIGGVVTFKKSILPQALAEAVPLDRIVLETDAPYLTPAPHRGKRNESAFVPHIIAKLAEVYQTTPETVAATTTETALRTFPLEP